MRSPPAIAKAFPQPGKSHTYGSDVRHVSTYFPYLDVKYTYFHLCVSAYAVAARLAPKSARGKARTQKGDARYDSNAQYQHLLLD